MLPKISCAYQRIFLLLNFEKPPQELISAAAVGILIIAVYSCPLK